MKKLTFLGLIAVGATSLAAQPAKLVNWTASAPAAAEKFEPRIVARPDTEESMLAITPDQKEIFWGVSRMWFPMSRVSEIWHSRRTGQGWTAPERAPFSTGYSDGDPFVSYDGKQLFFVSIRPVGPPRKDFDLYVMDRTGPKAGQARNLGPNVNSPGDEFYPSVDGEGTLYFASERSGKFKIYRSRRAADGSYGAPEMIPGAVNEGFWSFNPFVSRDGKTMVFTALNREGGTGKGDIWVATKGSSGEFGNVRNLGPSINTAEEEFHPTLSPDGKALFFIRRNTSRPDGNADIYWIRTSGLGL